MKDIKKAVKSIGTLSLMGCAVLSSQLVIAAESGWLGGFSIGESSAEIDDARITAALIGSGFTTIAIEDDDTDTAYKIFGGYKFNKHFIVEGGYFNLGQFGYTATTTPAGTLTGRIKLQGLNIDAVGILPITDKFSAFGRLGVNYAEAKDNFSSTGAVTLLSDPNPSKRDTNYKAGLGLQYDFTDTLGMRGEWERYRINDAVGNDGDINMYSIGLVFMFGQSKPAPKAATPAPVVVEAPPVRTERYCSILNLTFEINADEIQRDDKERLAVVSTFLKKYPDTTAVIEGHTDNVGTEEDNMHLSQHRAQSVVNYLVADHKIAVSRLKAVGYGETRPIADNETGEGKKLNRRIHAIITCATDLEGLVVIPARTVVAMEIEFDPYKNDIKPEYRDELRKVANFMKANPTVTATVEGHADNVAGVGAKHTHPTAEVSMKVSQERAQSVVNYLVDNHGVDRSRLATAAFGATRRTDYGTTLAGQQENRRVNIIFNYAK